jgi:dimeric dUTPase (all-alpha-NTP-PPase superfamily)
MNGLNVNKLFSLQEVLDDHIEKEHGLANKDTTDERLLALQVELGELANETRCFKFWSLKPASEKAVILEEYVDGLHFILSIGLAFGFRFTNPIDVKREEDLVNGFLAMFEAISEFRMQPNKENYHLLFMKYLILGEQLDFGGDEIQSAYEEKNETNHQRQEQGY